MTVPDTFEAIARRLARDGAAGACAIEARALEARAASAPPLRGEEVRRAARGLRIAARLLADLGGPGAGPFRPVGLRGAIAAGHVALAAGRARQAELVGAGAAEAAPDAPAGLRLVAQALFAQRRYGLAVRALRGALALDPDDAFTRALHAEALWFAGERDAARAAAAAVRAPLALALGDAIRSGALARAGKEATP